MKAVAWEFLIRCKAFGSTPVVARLRILRLRLSSLSSSDATTAPTVEWSVSLDPSPFTPPIACVDMDPDEDDAMDASPIPLDDPPLVVPSPP